MATQATPMPAAASVSEAATAPATAAAAPAVATTASPYLGETPRSPWSLDFTSIALSADLDADGIDEIVTLNGTTVGVLSRFEYSDISASWASDWNLETLGTCRMSIPGAGTQGPYQLSTLDQFQVMTVAAATSADTYPQQGLVIHKPGTSICIVTWSDTDGLLSQGIFTGPIGTNGWCLGQYDQMYVADVDGDGIDELVMVNATPSAENYLGVLRWTGTTLETIDLAKGVVPTGRYGGGSYSLGPSDLYTVADVDGDGHEEIVVLRRASNLGWVAVFKWDTYGVTTAEMQTFFRTQNVVAQSTTTSGNWVIGASDTIYRVKQTGLSDYLLFTNGAATNPWIAVVQWQTRPYMLKVMSKNMNYIPAVGTAQQINFDNQSQFTMADVNGDGNDEIAILNGDTSILALAYVNAAVTGGNLTPLTQSGTQVWPPSGTSPEWPILTSNAMFRTTLTTTQGTKGPIQYFGVLDQSLQALGALGTAGTSANPVWACELRIDRVAPSWGLGLLGSCPTTPFTAFTGDQLAAYTYISDTLDLECNHDIRSIYTNTNKSNDFAAYATQLIETPWPQSAVTYQSDWSTVQQQIVSELQAVSDVMQYFDNVEQLMSEVLAQQIADMWYCAANLGWVQGSNPPDTSKIQYWLFQTLDALLWTAGALTGVPGQIASKLLSSGLKWAGVALSCGASVAGSFFAQPSFDDTPGPQNVFGQLMPLSNAQSALGDDYADASTFNGELEAAVLQDAVLLPMLQTLVNGPWSWDPTSNSDAVAQMQNENRIAFYAMLIPSQFTITCIPTASVSSKFPGAPALAQYVQGSNTYVLANRSTETPSYPTAQLLTDLFTNLSLLPSDVLRARGVWSNLTVQTS